MRTVTAITSTGAGAGGDSAGTFACPPNRYANAMTGVRPLLAALLSTQPRDAAELTLSLVAIEALIGVPLPRAAYARSYWAESGPTKISTSLARVGWRMSRFDRDMRAVTFVRVPSISG